MDDIIDRRFWLLSADGAQYFPVQMRDRDSGKIAFRVSALGNTKGDAKEIETLEEVAALVVREGNKVRVRPATGGSTSLIRVGGKAKMTWEAMPGFSF